MNIDYFNLASQLIKSKCIEMLRLKNSKTLIKAI